MSTSPQPPGVSPEGDSTGQGSPAAPAAARQHAVHQVVFVTYPKLLFVWPLVLAGLVFWPFGARPAEPAPAAVTVAQPGPGEGTDKPPSVAATPPCRRLEILGWVYIWIAVLVLMTLGVDVDRNVAAFWVILFGGLYVLGMWLHDVKGFTLFGNIYRWFASLDVQYDRNLGLALSLVLLVPYVIMLIWGRFNDRWRITHNEFEHYSLGRMDDSLGRGAKTVRTVFPDVFELLLGLAGTLIVYNASGTRELRRIPHVMFLPLVRRRLNKILERTAITMAQAEDEEDDEEDTP